LRVLLVSDYAAPEGGAEILVLRLREQLRQGGDDARLFASVAHTSGLTPQADYGCFGTMSRWRTLVQTMNPHAAWRLRQVLREFRPEVVHLNLFLTQLSPLILPVLRGYPLLFQIHWARVVCPTGRRFLTAGRVCEHRYGRACMREKCVTWWDWVALMGQMWMLRRFEDVLGKRVPLADGVAETCRRNGFRCDATLMPGTSLAPVRRSFAGEPLVVFAGRLVKEKGVDRLLRAFARAGVKEARLLVVGGGPERESLGQLSRELGIDGQVEFAGHLPPDECRQRLERGWIQVVPSIWEEPYGMTAVEGMAQGRAVVVSRRCGAARHVATGANGWVVDPEDEPALAALLREAMRDAALCARMGDEARRYAERHLGELDYVTRLRGLYRETIEAQRGS
jgi:glycosyltransferase involved in cell wall biosynthesis